MGRGTICRGVLGVASFPVVPAAFGAAGTRTGACALIVGFDFKLIVLPKMVKIAFLYRLLLHLNYYYYTRYDLVHVIVVATFQEA